MNLFRYFQIREIQKRAQLLRRIIERNGVDKRVNGQATCYRRMCKKLLEARH